MLQMSERQPVLRRVSKQRWLPQPQGGSSLGGFPENDATSPVLWEVNKCNKDNTLFLKVSTELIQLRIPQQIRPRF